MKSRTRPPWLPALLLWLIFAPAGARADSPLPPDEEFNDQARKLFGLGKLDEAVKLYEKAYEANALPKYLYNLGMCRLKMDTLPALRLAENNFMAFVRQTGEEDLKAAGETQLARVRARIAGLEARKPVAPAAGAPAAPPAGPAEARGDGAEKPRALPLVPASDATARTDEPPTVTPLYKRWWLWTAIGVALAGGAAAAALAVTSSDSRVPEGPVVDMTTFQLRSPR